MKQIWESKKDGNIEISTFAAITPKGLVVNPEHQNEYNDFKKQRFAEMLLPLIVPNYKRNKNGMPNMRDASNRYFMKRAMSEDLQFLEGWYNHERQKKECTPTVMQTDATQLTSINQKLIRQMIK